MERELCVIGELTAQSRQLAVHLERDEERALGIVLVAHRRAEEREQRVARELLHVAAVAADDCWKGRR